MFRQPPCAAIGQYAEIVEVPVDPCRIGEPVYRTGRCVITVNPDDPAILVVDTAQHHQRRAVRAKAHLQQTHGAQALQRRLAVLLAQRRQRVDIDARQGRQVEVGDRAVSQVDEPE